MDFIISFFIIARASLLPDLDNDESTAKYQLGFISILFTIFMKTTSSVVFSLTRMKNDKNPVSQHRYLWHSMFISILIFVLFWFYIEDSQESSMNLFQYGMSNNQLFEIISDNFTSYFCVIISMLSLKMGINSVTWRIFKLLKMVTGKYKIQKLAPMFLTLIMSYFILIMPLSQLRYIGLSVALGYFFHNFADLFSKGSIPLIFPIPAFWLKQMWWKPKLPFQLMTNGFGNYILNWFFFLSDCVLLYIVTTQKINW